MLKDDHIIYTGQLTYKAVDFTFVFDGKELRLIPFKDKRDEVNENWLRTPLANGAYMLNTPVMEEDYLCGICNETNQRIIFLVRRGYYLIPHGNHLLGGNYVLVTKVIAYILCKYDRKLIDRISFLCPEIDAIYPLQNSFTFSLGADFEEFNETGIISITTKDFDSTTSEPQKFIVDNSTVISFRCSSGCTRQLVISHGVALEAAPGRRSSRTPGPGWTGRRRSSSRTGASCGPASSA